MPQRQNSLQLNVADLPLACLRCQPSRMGSSKRQPISSKRAQSEPGNKGVTSKAEPRRCQSARRVPLSAGRSWLTC